MNRFVLRVFLFLLILILLLISILIRSRTVKDRLVRIRIRIRIKIRRKWQSLERTATPIFIGERQQEWLECATKLNTDYWLLITEH